MNNMESEIYGKVIKIYNIYIWIILFFLGLTFEMNIIENKYLIVLLSSMFLFLIILMICDKSFSIKDHIKFDIRDIFLLVAMAIWRRNLYVYGVCDPGFSIKYLIIVILMYLYGKYHIIYMNTVFTTNDIYKTNVIFPLGLGLMIFNITSMISWYIYPPNSEIGRAWLSLMDPIKGWNVATFYAFHPLLFISLVFWGVITYKNNKIKSNMIIFLGIISSVWFWFVTKTRGPMVILFATVIIGITLNWLQLILKNGFKKYEKKLFYCVIFIVVFVIVGFICIKYVEPIKSLYDSSMLSRDGGILNNIRFKWAKDAVLGLAKYPFGGNKEIENSTTHVVWTSFASFGGIVPFLLIIIWNILVIKDTVVLSISKNKDIEKKLFIILPYIGVMLYSCTEDLIYYMFEMAVITIIAGMIRGEVISEKLVKIRNN